MSRVLDVGRLLAELSSADALRRDTAVARLAIAGARAVPALVALARDPKAAAGARVAAFEALEASPDARGVVTVAIAVQRDGSERSEGENDEIALAAIGVLAHAAHGRGPHAAAALDHLAATALDAAATAPRRLAALAALDGLPERHVRPVYDALRNDPASRVVARVVRHQSGLTLPLDEVVARGLPDDPGAMTAVLREEGETTAVGVLRRLVDAIRTKERRSDEERRAQWMAVRGHVHQLLAARNSRFALYDLRDALEQRTAPLPVGFLSAAAAIGDATCLDPIANAWLRAEPAERWWRDHLAEAFGAIVRRERITRRHPRLRALLQRSPEAGPLVALAQKTNRARPGPSR